MMMLARYGSHQKKHELTIRDPVAPTRVESSRAPESERPKISCGRSVETWNTFITRWDKYKRTSGVLDFIRTGELVECCDTEML